jgi:prolyl-tRNA editing enzyme YbaK/EbsC (Cys-tRNA(Pro) deacylase)
MEGVLERATVQRVQAAILAAGMPGKVIVLTNSARTAAEAAAALNIEVGQIASSLVFKLPDGSPLLIITSGRHRIDILLVAKELGIDSLGRADADYVKEISGFSVGGVAPLGWKSVAKVLIDQALSDYEVVWAAGGHPHAVFPTSYSELISCTGAKPMVVGD